MVTIKDVARKAGVSATTVSIVLNNKAEEKRIPKATAERIMKAVIDLNYRPDNNARRLRSATEKKITIALFWPSDYRVSLLGHLASSIKDELAALDPNTVLAIQTYRNNYLSELDYIFKNASYDGIIIGALSQEDLRYIDSIDPPSPIVMLNRKSNTHSTVGVDNSHLGLQAATLIRQKGYTEVAIISNAGRYMATKERTESFISACQSLDISILDKWIFQAPGSLSGGFEASLEYAKLDDRPHVLFCEDDYMAQGALVGLYKSNLRIPRDLEVLSFGMQSNSSDTFLIPSLSTISLPYEKLNKNASRILLDKIKTGNRELEHLLFEPETHLRESFTL